MKIQLGFLAALFLALKLAHQIDWSWLWVLSPLWIVPALALGIVAAVLVGVVVVFVVIALVEPTNRWRL